MKEKMQQACRIHVVARMVIMRTRRASPALLGPEKAPTEEPVALWGCRVCRWVLRCRSSRDTFLQQPVDHLKEVLSGELNCPLDDAVEQERPVAA